MDNSIVKLRGYKDGLHLIVNPRISLSEIELAIQELFAKMNQPLTGTSIQVDMRPPVLNPEDFKHLETHLTETYNLVVNSVNIHEESGESPILAAPATHSIANNLSQGQNIDLDNAQVVRQTIRSGQTTHCLRGSVIIYGDVNPGGEVISVGDIVVLGALRGTAHAGMNGELSSVIVAMELVPLQLQIGSYVNRPPVGQKPRGYPEIARVGAEDIIIVEEFIKF